MSERLYFDELKVGDRWVGETRVVTEEDVLQFAQLTGDNDPLHTDPEYAKNTPFRQQIAHGLLGLAYVAGLSIEAPGVHTVAFTEVRQWRFLQPIFFGDSVHTVTEVVELTPKGRRRGEVLWRRQLVNQRDQVVQEGELVTIVHVTPANRNAAKD